MASPCTPALFAAVAHLKTIPLPACRANLTARHCTQDWSRALGGRVYHLSHMKGEFRAGSRLMVVV
jgi:hypothetical protein